MAIFLLHHKHAPEECDAAYAAWKGFRSPLRREQALCACDFRRGEHQTWWRVTAATPEDALAMLPTFVADRTTATRAREFRIP